MMERLKEAGFVCDDTARTARSTLLQDLLTPDSDRDWNQKRLGDLISLEYGKALKEENRDGKGFPVYGSAGVIGHHSHANVQRSPVIIVGRKGTAGAVRWSSSPCSVIDTAFFVVPRTNDSYRFLCLLLQNADLPTLSAQTGVPGLNRERVYQTIVHMPSLVEQRRVVNIISSVDDVITDCDSVRKRATELRSGLLSDLLSGRYEIPASYDRFLNDL